MSSAAALDAPVWEIVTPRAHRLAGVAMAGFRQQDPEPVDLEIVPFPAVTMCIDLGERQPEVDAGTGTARRGSVVAGMAPGGVRARGQGIECLQIRLSPVLAGPVLGVTKETEGAVLDLDDVWGADAARLERRLRDTGSWDERFAIVEAELTRRLHASREVDPELAYAWRTMVVTAGRARVDELADDIGWSRKRLWSRFRAQLGIGPKRAARLIRFDDAAHRLASGRGPAEAAAESGYADQSHLHRDALEFAGRTPAAVARAAWLSVDDVAWPGAAHRPAS